MTEKENSLSEEWDNIIEGIKSLDEPTKAKLRILGMIIIRIIIFVNIAGWCYNNATNWIAAGWMPIIAAPIWFGVLVMIQFTLSKSLYKWMKDYIKKKNKGVQLINTTNMPAWKKEMVEGLFNPVGAIFGDQWNPEVVDYVKRHTPHHIRQQKQERRIHRNHSGKRWED